MYLNGWQRLWLLASILWAVVILALAGNFQSNGDQVVPSVSRVLFVVRLWIVPVGGPCSGRAAWVRGLQVRG